MAKLCGYYQAMTSFSEDGKYPKDVLKCFFLCLPSNWYEFYNLVFWYDILIWSAIETSLNHL